MLISYVGGGASARGIKRPIAIKTKERGRTAHREREKRAG